MNFDITLEDLQSIGINLAEAESEATLTELNDTLNERIGTEITEALTDEQLEQLLELQKADDEVAVTQWLEANVPELAEIVSDERDILLGELADQA